MKLNSIINTILALINNYKFHIVSYFCTVVFIISLFKLQVVNGKNYSNISNSSINYQITNQAERGIVLDKNGNILASNRETLDLYYNSNNIDFAKLANLAISIDKKLETDLAEIELGKDNLLFSNIQNNSDILKLTEFINNDESFKFQVKRVREYKYPFEFSHLIGYVGSVSENDISNGYKSNYQIGKYKLEADKENILKGSETSEINLGDTKVIQPGLPGSNITLTINKDWQVELYKILEYYTNLYQSVGAAAVVINTSNGDVTSLVSYPGFDTNAFSNNLETSYYNSLLEDGNKPLVDKTISMQAAPGSTLKLITAYSLLEKNIVNKDTNYFSNRCISLGSSSFCEFGKYFYGDMNIERALYKSSNLFFCNYSLDYVNNLGINNLIENYSLFNIGQLTGINLSGEIAGNLDSAEYKQSIFEQEWYPGDTCNAVIGQGSMLTTPIQMAMVPLALENGGKYYRPNIIKSIINPNNGEVNTTGSVILKEIPISNNTKELISSGMYQAAHNPEGTVYYFLGDTGHNVKVKTGSAEAFENVNGQQVPKVHSWMVGTFEHENTTYSFCLFFYYGGGGFYVGPVINDFLNKI